MKKTELIVVMKAAIAMAQKDGKLEKPEAELIQSLLDIADLTLTDIGGLDVPRGKGDPEEAVVALESVKAKRVYLLTLACVAMIDGVLDPAEAEFFAAKAKKLGVGTIDVGKMTLEKAIATLERVIAEGKSMGGSTGPQPSDIDLM
ncbi:MAG: hypothetical protein A2600_09475 [Candidatus Lambdaproteobacteria bacterium RIFOXYD1_FULL_56_27]|uniref:Co-chaperone DjlA N-terminal domain-containing protein n=1 Tax=Candidatus Lambdaproteobacteria bacterium RIFOXYD2_FULL_56_26 TaxID=1817773 RepID=A0A1F6GV42_9PROT|nr:MAG: hypothetical protein A2557_04745 [Candidatus Lambdaproteobacteria bacterium RIFOXYD2_FULL_56_26]OGH02280.1 MAG: hypothetical protein A2426_03225 [Candidatus Lambdaproteobacteria bacterium RIFOXYC1_FULL_56_13]OGH10049.1 MAG: hypothetical protein A2600_09475 [Candidatus Lambdaproteobacteria bacterium RIFOXYD1_FULL_56_27]